MLKKFFITWGTHNSRYSDRMKLYKVEKKEWFFLNLEDRKLMYKLISDKIEDKWIKNYTLNVLSDHIHLVIIYDDEKLSKFIWEIKWAVSFEFSRIKKFSNKWDWKWIKIWANHLVQLF